LALMTDLPGRNDMFPFDARRAIGVLARRIAAAFQVYTVTLEAAAAIKLNGLAFIEAPANLLGLVETLGRCGG